jgi:hypothetical protein
MKLRFKWMGSKAKTVLYNPVDKTYLYKNGKFIEDGGEATDFGLLKPIVKKYWKSKGIFLEYKSFLIYKKGFMGFV